MNELKTKTPSIPSPKKISNKKIIEILREEIKRKDDIILKLREENELLLKLSIKNAKKRIAESENIKKNLN